MKQILDSIIACKKKHPHRPILIGLSGLPRSGKTTIIKKICKSVQHKNIACTIYHGDWDLIRDSQDRRKWIWNSFSGNVPQYIDKINTLNWLNFSRAHSRLITLLKNIPVVIKSFYNRDSGSIDSGNILLKPQNGVILYENVILGLGSQMDKFDIIFFMGTSYSQCLVDSISSESTKRNPVHIASRFILTAHGANIFFRELFDNFSYKVIPIDRKGNITTLPEIYNVDFFPVPVK